MAGVEDLRKIADIAEAAARTAGLHLRANIGADVDHTKANAQDLVTKVDTECQNIVESFIQRHYPHHGILGEESVDPGADAQVRAVEKALAEGPDWLWIIDPIDGTTNFVHSLPLSVVSIGVACKGHMKVGVIYDPYRDELFSATEGGGMFLNGKRTTVSTEPALAQSVVACGISMSVPAKANPSLRACKILATKNLRGLRLLGSACLHMAWVACGRLSGWWQLELAPWDLAAGAILISEAGGRVESTHREPYTIAVRNTFATNGLVHEELYGVLSEAKCLAKDDIPE
eukprot:m.100392 g.100392  ORF g.100392 m.100392 type:complete len:288 (+) comp15395_c0_seq2:121-984(+)